MNNEKLIGLSCDNLVLAEYKNEWPIIYSEEKRMLSEALKDYKTIIEHIGSTAIPGMMAKPIIDIMIGVNKEEDLLLCVKHLEIIGYVNFGECGRPGRIFMVKGKPENCTHHLHIVKSGCKFWEDNLFFREYIKNNKHMADEYKNIKLNLIEEFKDSRTMYRIMKSEFIEKIISMKYSSGH